MRVTQSKKPNVIVFLTDQQRWDTTGVHGNPLDLTPNFDRMAMQGTHLFNTFTPQPVCGPARSCLQTGMYATTTGCYRNGIPLPKDVKTLAHYFREGGYTTGYIGKWHLGHEQRVSEPERGGYEYWLGANAVELISDAYDTVLYDHENEEVRLPGYRVDAVTDAAIRYVAQHAQSDPFYLFVSYLEPHHQNHRDDYPAPVGYAERYTGRWTPPDLATLTGTAPQHLGGYYGMVKRLDEALGRLLDALRSLNILDDTIVLYTSDHGCHFKTRNGEYKRSCHESSIRVPAAIQGPGFFGGGRVEGLVSLVDIPPTLLDAAGLPVPETMQGRSILPALRGGATDGFDDVFVQISESQVGRAIRTRRWKYSIAAPGKDGRKESGSDQYEEEFLYDLVADPYELTNLIGYESHEETANILRKKLIKRMVEVGEPKPTITPAPMRKSGQRTVTCAEANP